MADFSRLELYVFLDNSPANGLDYYGLISRNDLISLIISLMSVYGDLSNKSPNQIKCPKTPTSERIVENIERANTPPQNAPTPASGGRQGAGNGPNRGNGGSGVTPIPVLPAILSGIAAFFCFTQTTGARGSSTYAVIRIRLRESKFCDCGCDGYFTISRNKCVYDYELMERTRSFCEEQVWFFDGNVFESGTFETGCAAGECPGPPMWSEWFDENAS
jgi:hypothetical protein